MELIGQANLENLLQDVNHFLIDTLENEPLSTHALEARIELQRKIALLVEPRFPSSYVEMEIKKNSPEEYVQPNVNNNNQLTIKETYEGFSENRNTKSSEDTVCNLEESISLSPPEDLHAANLHAANLREIAVKYGPLLRKEKFIFVEQYKRCWAAVYGKFFHIFLSDKDSKPFQSIDLNGWNARSTSSITCRDPNRRVSCFELFKPGKKTYQFVGRNSEDMLAWVKALTDSSKRRQLPSIPNANRSSKDESIYDDVENLYLREKIYHVIGNENDDSNMWDINYDDIENYRQSAVYSNSNETEEIYDDVTNLKAANKNFNGTKRRIVTLIDSFNKQGSPKSTQQMYESFENNASGNS